MKAVKQFISALIGALVVVIGAEVAVIMAVGKEGLREMPVVGDLFTVVESSEAFEEPRDERLDEIDAILAKLKEREALAVEHDDELSQLQTMREDIEAIEQQNRKLFDRIRQLYPIISQARQETLKVLAKKYEKLAPESAAKILAGKSDEECAELLLVMSDRTSAAVLEAFAAMGDSVPERDRNQKRATKISQIMRNTLLLSDEKAALFSPP
jgi:flagellar motility protein MotE (MotC chaperone)